MTDFSIPAPEEASLEPSELTKIEMADLSASKRNTVLYERTIDSLNKHIDYLKNKLDASDNERREAISKLDDYVDESYKVPLLRRENIEMYVMFALVTVSMAIGSALISSYPKTNTDIPWQFGLGWGMVGIGALFGIFGRVIVWSYYKFTK
jgi:hypothetical protein